GYELEQLAEHNLILTALDCGKPALSGTINITVAILDDNDNAPIFEREVYHVEVSEKTLTGTTFITLNATDADEGSNAELFYSFNPHTSEEAQMKFRLNSRTGDLIVNEPLDFEEAPLYELFVQASDNGPNPMTGHCKVIIKVVDSNDNQPEIIVASSQSSVSEDVPIGTVIALFSVTDLDSGNNGRVNCHISSNNEFELQQTMDNVYALVTAELLDRERKSSFNITIVVKDEGTPPLANNKTICLNVLDVNDNAPSFSRASYEIPVPENNIPGTLLCSITAVDPDANLNGVLKYYIEEKNYSNNTFMNFFSINRDNGNIYSLQSFDYEKQTFFTFNVIAKDSGTPQLSNSVTVKITVLDENDNIPVIVSPWRPHGSIVSDIIPRSAEEGYLVTKVIAIDDDSVQNSRITYHLLQVTDQTLFTLNQESICEFKTECILNLEALLENPLQMFNGSVSADLLIKEALDREKQAVHNLILTALDCGIPALSGSINITVTILDENDNAPKFEKQIYEVEVSENTIIGATFVTLNATDADEGLNAELLYSFNPHTSEKAQMKFRLNSRTGELSVNELLDFEQFPLYELFVQAKDFGPNPLTGHCKVIIKVVDSNDNRPEIIVASSQGSVSEDVPIGTVLALFSVTDLDSGNNGRVNCHISDNVEFELQQTMDNVYALVTAKLLDRERKPSFNITIIVKDEGTPPLTNNKTIFLNVLDVNDNAPFFSRALYEIPIAENNIPGSLLCSITAKDPDADLNGALKYSIKETNDSNSFTNYFSINRDNGNIYSLQSFDYEQQTFYTFNVVAKDSGALQLSSSVTINITVLDENDNTPVIVSPWRPHGSIVSDTIPSSADEGYLVTKVIAIDDDSVQNSRITYHLLQVTDQTLFTLNQHSGELRTRRRFGFRDSSKQRLVIQARDNGNPSLSSTVTILISRSDPEVEKILDVNDNAPRFPFTVSRINISESKLKDERFLLVKALDPDDGNNSVCNYKLSENVYFNIAVQTWNDGSVSADLLIKEALDREQQAVHNLILTAVDCGKPALSGSINITVIILDDNDNAPKFERQIYQVEVSENTLIGTTFITLNATDADEGSNAELLYSFNPHTSEKAQMKFHLNSRTGELSVNELLDFEQSRQYELFVQAKDNGPNPMTGHCKVIIKVLDSNDNQPEIIVASLKSSVLEDVPIGTVIALFSVTDMDSGKNGRVNCRISNNDEFKLQQTMDNVYALVTATLLDRERRSSFNVTIVVKDEGSPPLTNNRTIPLNLLDVNDNAPSFSRASFEIPIPENNIPGTLNGALKYSIVEKNDVNKTFTKYFSINSENGNIYSMQSFDYEQQTFYTFEVVAKDSGTPQLSSSVTVKITVLDENDNSPVIVSPWRPHGSIVSDTISSSAEEGYLVTKVIAIDEDSVQNSRITYHLLQVTDQTLFTLNQYSGELRTRRRFSLRDSSKQRLVIQARDNGNPSLSSTVTILISKFDPEVEGLLTINDEVETEYVSSLNMYLMIGLASASLLLFLTIVICAISHVICQKYLLSLYILHIFHSDCDSKKKIDRESICEFKDECVLNLEALLENPLQMFSVEVEILDVNDNAPRFPFTVSQINISESKLKGERFLLVKAVDIDVGNNTVCNYKLSENVIFEIAVQTWKDGSVYADLVIKDALDREEQAVYNLILTALDCGKPALSGSINITVTITDENDNAPKFEREMYQVEVSETTLIGTTFITLNATDADEGSNAELLYSFIPHTSEKAQMKFSLNSRTGELSVKELLDFEQSPLYELFVQTKDKGSHPMTGHCKVIIKIIDSNDNKPEIIVASSQSSVSEDVPIGTVIALFSVTDLDSGNNGRVNCHISDNDEFKLQQSMDNVYALVTAELLDRERKSTFNITIIVKDKGTPPLTNNKTIYLNILDVNDNAPTFSRALYEIPVPENNIPGTLLCSVTAMDPDADLNGAMKYSIKETNDFNNTFTKYFSINRDNGNIYSLQSFDYEKQTFYTFDVVAKDSGIPQLSSSVTVKINVLDENDNTPVIVSPWRPHGSIVSDAIPSSAEEGYLVTKVIAIDDDSVQNSRITYHLLQVTDQTLFSLNQYTGELRTRRRLDECVLNLEALLENPLQMFSVEVEILDVNDNAPRFPFTVSQINISESKLKGERFLLVKAVDIDVGNNTVCNYKLSENVIFEIAVQTWKDGSVYADLVIKDALDREEQAVYNLILTALDCGKPALSGSINITVTIIDENDNAPKFEREMYQVEVSETTLIGTTFITLNATDADEGSNAELLYSFISHTSEKAQMKFSLNSRTGELGVKELLDFEQSPLYELFVQAKDKGFNAMTGHCKVIIKIIDSNDNKPEIIVASSQSSVSEDVPIGTVIALFSVTDLDSGNNGRVNCHISDNDEFKLQQSMDNVYALVTAELLDRERKSTFNITIIVKDKGTPPLTNNKTIYLNILDVNDNAPTFSRALYEIPVPENNIPGTLLCSVTAMDPDADLNGAMKYSIKETNDFNNTFTKYFSINRDNGNIYSLQSFDYEIQTFYTFDVVAKDSGIPQLSSSVTVKINVLDENDNTPVIVSPWRPHGSIVSDAIPSSAEEGYLVTKVIAIDDDSVQNSRITYHLLQVTDQTLFSLNQYTGELRTRRRLGVRDSSKQRLVIQARDNGNPSLSSTVTILISRSIPEVEGLLTPNDEVETEYLSSLNIYLMIGLATASFLFLLTIVICTALKCHRNPSEDSTKSSHRISCYSQRDSMISDLPAHSTLYSSDAYWHSVLLAESRKGKMLVRQSMPNGTGFIVSSLERNPEQGTISELADTPIQVRV
uniref:Cadherin domain-containing protein n=1 Tax=Erpetoichthys calabaricus TaxID=27687 RepID=A0A8C4XAQ6_ERPCA